MIIMVACALVQHSPILGQPASSQTVCSLCSRTIVAGLGIFPATGALTRIQSGLRRTRRVRPVRLFGVARRARSLVDDRRRSSWRLFL